MLADEYDMVYFPGDDLFAASLRPRGLPIGNLTSQFWSNVYMNALDWFVVRELGCPAYLRYVDDFALFADGKRQLWEWKEAVLAFLADLRLTVHESAAQVQPVASGIPWLGFVVYPTHRLLKRRNVVNFARRLARNYRSLPGRPHHLCRIGCQRAGLDQPCALRRYVGVAKGGIGEKNAVGGATKWQRM